MFGKKADNNYEVFVTFDSKAKAYDLPVFVPGKEVLMRDIINLMNNPQHQTAVRVQNAEDFSLFKIGTYDLKTSKLDYHAPEHIANFHELRAMSNWKPVEYKQPEQSSAGPVAL